MIPLTEALFLVGVLSALYLLFIRGDEEWYFPLFALGLVLLTPFVVDFAFRLVAPFAPTPVYLYGFYDVEGVLKESVKRMKEAFDLAYNAALVFAYAIEGAAAAMTAALAAVLFGVLLAPLTGGASLAVTATAMRVYEIADAIFHVAATGYNVATGMMMTYHIMHWLGEIAETWVPTLFFLGMLLMLLPRVRGLGALLFGVGLFLYVATIAGAYTTAQGIPLLQWMGATSQWANQAPKPEPQIYTALAVEGDGIALLRYNATVRLSQVREALIELNRSAYPIALFNKTTLKHALDFFSSLAKNGSDWVAAGWWTPTLVGVKNWTGLGQSRTYIVHTWLDVPRKVETLYWCPDYSMLEPYYRAAVGNAMLGNVSAQEWMDKMKKAECDFYKKLLPWARIYAGPQDFWKMLTADVNITVTYNNKTLLNETRAGYVGVWGWLVPPASEAYKGGNVTAKRGVLRYDVGLNATNYTKPATKPTHSNFTIQVPNAGKPQKGGSLDFYNWTKVCTWCCGWTCDPTGYCWCDKWCSTSREEWEEPKYQKVLKPSAANLTVPLYGRPWVPEGRREERLRVAFTYRNWTVTKEEKYGKWSNGEPPSGASCTEENKTVYKRIIFWDVQRNSAYVYGFAWLGGVALSADARSVQLPDTYDEAPTKEGNVELINLLRGAEYDQECSTFVMAAGQPKWSLVPKAAGNMTRVNRDLFFALLASGNYSRAYLNFLRMFAPVDKVEPAASVYRYYQEAVRPRVFHPMPETEPRGYSPYNFYVACVRFDWRPGNGSKLAYGRVVLYPGNSTWLVYFPMGDSNTTRKLIGVWIQRWRWIMNNPPPPPPASLAASWPIPWNNTVALPYVPAQTPPMPKPDKRWGVSIWDVGFTLNIPWAFSEIWGRLFVALFVAVFAPVVVLEVLSAVFGFPSFGQYLMRLAVHVVQELAFWFQIRLMLKSKWFTRLARFMGSPIKRASIRLVRRLALKGAVIARRYRDRAREYVERRFGVHPEAVNEQVRRRIEEAVWRRLRRAEEALARGGRRAAEVAKEAAKAAYEAAKVGYRVAKTVHEYTRGDLIHLLRRILPKVDYAIDALMDEVARRHPWLYYTLLWHLDDKPRWVALINPAYLRRLYLEGRITRERYEELMALREYILARRAAAKARAVAERVEEFAVAQKMREIEREAVQRARQAYMELIRRLAVKDWEREITKSVEELMRGGVSREEAVRRAVSEVVGDVERLVRGVYEPFLEMHMGAFSKFAAFFRQITGVEPRTAREAAELLVGARIEGERVVVDPSLRARFLRHAEQFWALWEEYWLSRPVPYDARRFARALAVDEIRASLPTLRAVAVARAVAIGAVKPEEAERMLRPPVKELTLGVEEYVGRVTPLERGAPVRPHVARQGLAERLAVLKTEKMAESAYRDVYVVSALTPMAAEPWALKLLEKAVKAAREGDEKARREVLRESFEYFRRFGMEHSWLAYMRRVYAVEKPEAVEVLRAFERAVRTALSGDREEAMRQFKTEVERLREFYAARGGESAVRTIERLEKEYVKLLEKVKPEVLRDLAPVEQSAREAQRLRAVLERLSDVRAAREGWELFREGDVGAAGLSLLYRELVERVREAAARHGAVVEAASEAREVVRQYETLRPLLRMYVEASPAERVRLESALVQTAEALRKRVEAVSGRLSVAEPPPEFYVKLAEAYVQLYRMRVVDREERVRAASQIGEELRKTYSPKPLAEFWMPDPLLYAIAAEHRRLVEELKAAKAAGGGDAVKRIAAELSALVELAHRHGSAKEVAEVFKAVYAGKEPYVAVREAQYDVALRLWQTAERVAALEKVKRDVSKELEPLRKVEVRLPGYREALERVSRLVEEAEALARAGRYAEAEGLLKQAKSLAEALNRVEKAVGARLTKIEAPGDVTLYLDAWAAVRLSTTASLLYTEEERRALTNALRELYHGRERRLAEAVAAVRREYEPYFTTVRLLGREVEVPVFKQPTVPAEVFERALAVVLLAELARRQREVAEHVGKRIEAIALNALEELSLRAGVEEAKRVWAKAIREAREALQPPFAKLSTGDADVYALRRAAEAVLEVAGRLGVKTRAVEAALELTRPGAAEAVVKYFKTLEEFRKTPSGEREEELRRLGQEAPNAISLLLKTGARPGEESAKLVEVFRREALEATTTELARLRAELEKYLDPDSARLLIRIASISPSAAEAALALYSAREVVGGAKDVERARAVLKEYVKALEAYPRLVEYLRSPVLGERELAYVIWASEKLNLKTASEMLRALGRAYELFDAYGRERLYNTLYDQLLPYLGWEPERALLRAPVDAHVMNRLGASLVKSAYSRWLFFDAFGEALRESATLVDLPITVGMPVKVEAADLLFFLPRREYPDKVARHVKRWDWGGVREGIQRYYKTEGRQHRALAELLARAGRVLALEGAAEALRGRAPDAVAAAAAARAALEEAQMLYRAKKLTGRDVDASKAGERYSQHLRQLREFLMQIDEKKLEELRRWFGPGALSLVRIDPEEAVSRLIKWATPERVLAWLVDLKLEGVADTVAKSIEAYRLYRRFERWMEPRRTFVREGGVVSVAKALDVEARYQPSMLEDAVVRSVGRWAHGRVKRLEEEVSRVASHLARHHAEGRIELPSAVAQWLWERGYFDLGRLLREVQPSEEVYRQYRDAVRGVVEELKAVAKFSPGAKHEVERIAKEWYGEGGLRRYVAVIALQELAKVEPARAREAALYKQLPEELRRMAEAEVADVEKALVREGFYDSALRPVWRALWLRGREGEDPRAYAERLIARIEALAGRGDLPDEVAERTVSALRELAATSLDNPLLYERAVKAGDAVAEAAAHLVRTGALGLGYGAAELLKRAAEAVGRIAKSRELLLEAIYRAMDRDVAEALETYRRYLAEGRMPAPRGLVQAYVTRSGKVADFLARRLALETALHAQEGEVLRFYFVYHPALGGVLREVVGRFAAGVRDAERVQLGVAPPEYILTTKAVGAVLARDGVVAYSKHLDEVLKKLYHLSEWWRVEKFVKPEMHEALRATNQHYRDLLKKLEVEWYDPKALELYLSSIAAHGFILRLIEEARQRREALWSWPDGNALALLYRLSVETGMEAFDALISYAKKMSRASGRPLLEEAKLALNLGYLRRWLEFMAGETMAPAARREPYFTLAARLYAAASGEDVEKVIRRAEEKLEGLGLPPGFKIEDEPWWTEWVEAKRMGKTEAKKAEALEKTKPPEAAKAAEAVKQKAAEVVRPAEVLKPPEEVLRRLSEGEKPVQRPAEEARERPHVGFIPERYRGVSAVSWLASARGRVELSREAAEAVDKAVRRAVERVKARYVERLMKRGGMALVEAAESLVGDVYSLIWHAVDSPEALHYLAILLDRAEDVVHGMEPRSPVEADAARVFAEVRERLERIRAELGEEAAEEAWRYAYAVGREVLRALISTHENALRGIATVEQALRLTAFAGAATESLIALHHGLYSEAVVSAVAGALALVEESRFERAVEYVKRAAEAAYEALREVFEKARVALERLYELFVEAVARIVGWVDEHRAWLFLAAAAAAGVVTWAFANDVLGSVELGRLAEAASIAPIFGFAREAPARPERVKREVAEAWVERGEPLLRQTEKLYQAVKEKSAKPGDLRSLGSAERAAAVLAAHAFRRAAEAYLREGLERAVVVFRLELGAVREGLGEIMKREPGGGGFIRRVLQQLEIREGAGWVEGLVNAVRDELSRYGGATVAEKALAALHTLETGGAYTKAAAGAMRMGRFVELLEAEPKTAYGRFYKGPSGRGRFKAEDIVERVKLERLLAPGFAEEGLQKELEGEIAKTADRKEAAKRVGEILQSRLEKVEKAPVGAPALAGLLATDVTFEKENKAVKLSTTHLGMAELFARVFGLSRISVNFKETRHGERPQMELRAEPPEEIFRQYGRVLKWLAEEGGWEQLKAVVEEGVKALSDKAAGKGDDEVKQVDPQRVAEEVVQELRKAYEEAAKKVEKTLDYYTQPEKYWAGVAREMAFENASLARFFLSWLSMYLWAVKDKNEKAVADSLTASKAVAEFLTAAVMGDGSIQSGEVTLTIGKLSTRGEEDGAGEEGAGGAKTKEEEAETITHVHKAALALGVLAKAGHAPERVYAKVDEKSRWFELAWGVDAARGFLSSASLWLYAVELAGGSDEIRIKYSRALEIVGVEARLEGFTTEGKRPKARLVVRLGGDVAEYTIRLHKNNTVVVEFGTTDREEAERRAAVLRAVGVRVEVKKKYDKSRGRDVWYIAVTTNALAADSVHETVRGAVADFLGQCRETGVLKEDVYRRLAAKFERGVPEWGEVRFSVRLTKDGAVVVHYRPSDPQSFREAVELLRGLGMRDSCEGEWCIVHFTAREPREGEEGYVYITADGLRYIGWLALHGDEKAQRLKEMLLREAEARGVEVRRRLEQYFREGEQWGSVKPPIEKEVEVEGKKVRVRVEAVEAGVKQGKTREHLVVEIRAKVVEENHEFAVEKEAKFFKTRGEIKGYVIIRDEGGREADYARTAAVLKALGVKQWNRKEDQLQLTGGALDALMKLEPVCATLGICQKT